MYGADRMNPYLHLKYGLTREFFETFRSLKYRGIEIPLVLMRKFHGYTNAQLRAKLRNRSYVRQKIKKHRFRSIADVQQKLVRWPRQTRSLARTRGRNSILIPGRLAFLAKKHFAKHRVILSVSNRIDLSAVKTTRLPRHFQVYRMDNQIRRARVPLRTRRLLQRQIYRICRQKHNHEIFGKPAFRRWLYTQSLQAVKQIQSVDAFIRKKPVRVLMDYDTSVMPGEALSLIAYKYRLPYVYVQYHMPMLAPLLPFRAAYYGMWGKNYKEWLHKKGVPEARIREIGSIRFEEALKRANKSEQWLRSKWSIPEQHLIIGYTTQTAKWMNDLFLRWLLQAMKGLPVTLVIKRHPKDKQTYRQIAARHPNVIVFPEKLHLYDLLNGIDALATVSSTTAVEAAILGKGIIVLQTDFPNDYYSCLSILSRSKAGWIASSPQQLKAYLQELSINEDSRHNLADIGQQFLADTLRQDGSPGKRVRSLVSSLLRT